MLLADKRNKKQQDSDFIAAYHSEYPFILKLCAARLGGNMDLAEDCAQDAFYILYKKTVSGVTVDNPRAFLAKTANLIVLNRRTKRTAEAARQADLEDMADSLSDDILRKWFIGKVTIQMQRTAREKMTDSLKSRTLKILFSGKRSPIRPRLVLRNMKLRPGQPYSYDNYVESVQKINGAGVFSTTDFQFTPRPNTDTLDLAVTCTFEKPFDFYVEGNFNNRTQTGML